MGFLTALGLSLANLLTKKGRTLMTSFAGSIGIIGIATILALSTGVNAYIARTEEEALTSYPLSIQTTGVDLEAEAEGAEPADAPEGELTTAPSFASMLRSQKTNDLAALKRFLDTDDRIRQHTAAIKYHYRLTPRIYQVPSSADAPLVQVSPDQAMETIAPAASAGPFSSMVSLDSFHQLPATAALYEDQASSLMPGLAYTPALTDQVISQAASSQIVKDQLAHPDTDVFTGRSFADLAAGRGTPSLDFTSLFTVDGQALRSAFTIDTDVLQAQLAGAAGDLAGAWAVWGRASAAVRLAGLTAWACSVTGRVGWPRPWVTSTCPGRTWVAWPPARWTRTRSPGHWTLATSRSWSRSTRSWHRLTWPRWPGPRSRTALSRMAPASTSPRRSSRGSSPDGRSTTRTTPPPAALSRRTR